MEKNFFLFVVWLGNLMAEVLDRVNFQAFLKDLAIGGYLVTLV